MSNNEKKPDPKLSAVKGGQQAPPADAQKKTQIVATQKLFSFPVNTSPEKIDRIINAWLMRMAIEGKPAQLGKTYCGGWFFNPRVFIQYLYGTKVTI